MARALRISVGTFVFALSSQLLLAAAAPIDPPGLSAFLAYAFPLLLGAVAGWIARTLAGLVGLDIGLAASDLVAVWMGLVAPPSEGEVAVVIVWFVMYATLASLAYVGSAYGRARRERRERGATPA